MKDRLVAMTLPFAAGFALVGVTASVAGLPGAAAVLLGLAVAIGLLGIQLRFDELDRATGQHLPQVNEALADHADRIRQHASRVRRDIADTRKHLDMLPSDTAYLQRLLGTVAPGDAALPVLGGWATTPRSVLAITEEIQRSSGPVTILECGSGTSTVLDALLLKSRGKGGHVYALESDRIFAEETRGYLRDHGVEEFATVIDAPIVQTKMPDGTASPWYDLTDLHDIGPVDILFVDGPVGTGAPLVRFPAFPLLADLLKPDALVVLDDTNRADEKSIVRLWMELEPAQRKLELVRVNGRATLMRAREVEAPKPRRAAAKKAPARATAAKKTATRRTPTTRKAAAPRKTAAKTAAKPAEPEVQVQDVPATPDVPDVVEATAVDEQSATTSA